jgi:hypothetical protein
MTIQVSLYELTPPLQSARQSCVLLGYLARPCTPMANNNDNFVTIERNLEANIVNEACKYY